MADQPGQATGIVFVDDHGQQPHEAAMKTYEQLREELHDALDQAEESIVALVDKAHEISLAGHDPTAMGAASGMHELVALIGFGAEAPLDGTTHEPGRRLAGSCT